MTAKLAAEDEC